MNTWIAGEAYEPFVGRWSRLVAEQFIAWLAPPAGWRWLDMGCGTGALSSTISSLAKPALVVGVDQSPPFVRYATVRPGLGEASFLLGDARALPVRAAAFDAAVSGLVLNFVPEPATAAAEMARAVGTRGLVAAYVWDYAEGMQLMRQFWDAATALDASAVALDEGRRFSICNPERLRDLFALHLEDVVVRPIDIPTVFNDFDDYWQPFLGGTGPAPGYVASLAEADRVALRESLRARLPAEPDGSIRLTARAWAVRGRGRD